MEKPFVLMNKDHPVLEAIYDDELRVFTRLEPIDLKFAPPAILWPKGNTDRRLLNEWWNDRAVPVSRMERGMAKDQLIGNLGLSLSDRYWMDPGGLTWDDVNLFEHGMSPINIRSVDGRSSFSPDASTGGDLPKQWVKAGSKWELVKHGSGTLRQEPYNEAVATALHRRFMDEGEYVPYRVQNGLSVCPNMLEDNEELVHAWDILKNVKKPNDKSDFQHCLDTLSGYLGNGQEKSHVLFEKMFICDLVIANTDRHYRNFGLIRDVDTLQYKGMAPVFDTGSSLWHDKPDLMDLSYMHEFNYETKPFGLAPEKLLGKFTDLSWVEPDRLKNFTDEAASILASNPYFPDHRLDAVMKGIDRNITMVTDHMEDCRNRLYAGFTDAVDHMADNGMKIE